MLPPAFDAVLLVGFGLVISFQVLIFSLVARARCRRSRPGGRFRPATSSFFGGAAVMQAVSGVAAAWGGIGAALATFAVALLVCTAGLPAAAASLNGRRNFTSMSSAGPGHFAMGSP